MLEKLKSNWKIIKAKIFGGQAYIHGLRIHLWPTNVLLLTNNGAYIHPFHWEFEQRGPRIFELPEDRVPSKYSGNMLITS